MKRSDEVEVVEKAHRPRFVEDCVREMIRVAIERFGHLGDEAFVSARQETSKRSTSTTWWPSAAACSASCAARSRTRRAGAAPRDGARGSMRAEDLATPWRHGRGLAGLPRVRARSAGLPTGGDRFPGREAWPGAGPHGGRPGRRDRQLTGPLVATGAEVIAVEPVPEMRAALPALARAVDGTAEDMPLDTGSADAVAVAQAFHWFNGDAALTEIHRVLRPGCSLALVWNRRDMADPLNQAIDELIAVPRPHVHIPHGGLACRLRTHQPVWTVRGARISQRAQSRTPTGWPTESLRSASSPRSTRRNERRWFGPRAPRRACRRDDSP